MAKALVTGSINKNIGQKLKFRRLSLGKNLTEVAKSLGVSFQQIQKYETGQNNISNSKLLTLSKILEVDVNYFFEEPTINNQFEYFENDKEIVKLVNGFNLIKNFNIRSKIIDFVEAIGK